ncbi:MAG: hypothetical protein E6K18_00260 [Methanobacteriota archaeon]|nr:MAG: hypothetical protein E6K18_00260 [Euryarchaeota archaeon]
MAEEEKKVSVAEVRKTVASSLGAAFGFVIGLLWSQVVLGGFAVAGISLTAQNMQGNWGGWAAFLVTALVVTVVMILLIIFISRWGSQGLRKKRAP